MFNTNKVGFRSKVNHPWTRHTLCSCDLDLDLMTLICEYDLDIPKTYLRTKNELSRRRLSIVRALQTDTQTDTQTDDCKQYHTALTGGKKWSCVHILSTSTRIRIDAGLSVWNSLPVELRDPDISIGSFRRSLKSAALKILAHSAH